MFGNPSLKEVWGETFYNIIILWKLTNFKEDRKFLLDKRLHSTLHLLRWNPRNDRVVCIISSSKNSIKSQCDHFENSFSFVIFLCKNYVKLTYFIFQKNSRTTIMKSSESVRISGASSESMILLLNRGRRPPSSSFGSVVVYFVLSLSLVQCGGHFLFWNRCQHFHEKSPFSVCPVLPTIMSSFF